LLGWLVPVTACLLFAQLILNQPAGARFSDTAHPGAMVALVLSNQSYAAYLPRSFQRTRNQLDGIAWTNGGSSNSSKGSLPPSKAD